MGISLETSGIKVRDDKCFLVNLNADPALNELLVYYLKVSIWSNSLDALLLFRHAFIFRFGLVTSQQRQTQTKWVLH